MKYIYVQRILWGYLSAKRRLWYKFLIKIKKLFNVKINILKIQYLNLNAGKHSWFVFGHQVWSKHIAKGKCHRLQKQKALNLTHSGLKCKYKEESRHH